MSEGVCIDYDLGHCGRNLPSMVCVDAPFLSIDYARQLRSFDSFDSFDRAALGCWVRGTASIEQQLWGAGRNVGTAFARIFLSFFRETPADQKRGNGNPPEFRWVKFLIVPFLQEKGESYFREKLFRTRGVVLNSIAGFRVFSACFIMCMCCSAAAHACTSCSPSSHRQ